MLLIAACALAALPALRRAVALGIMGATPKPEGEGEGEDRAREVPFDLRHMPEPPVLQQAPVQILDGVQVLRRLRELELGLDVRAEARQRDPAHERIVAAALVAIGDPATQKHYFPRRPNLLPELIRAINDDGVSVRQLVPIVARDPALASLGPDVLDAGFDEEEAVRRLRERATLAIGDALLDQRALSGIGNVFKAEVCFVERVNPFTPVSALGEVTLLGLVRTARRFLRMNVLESSGAGMVTYTGLRRTTRRGDPSARLWVYGRAGEPCRECGEPIVIERRGPHARPTYFCPGCQV